MLHVIVVAIVKAIRQIAVLVVEGRGNLLKLLVGHLGIQSVDLHLQTDEAVLGIVGVAHRLLNGLDAGTRRTEHDGIPPCILRLRQIAIDAVAAVNLQFEQVTVKLVGSVFLHLLTFRD